MGKDVGDVRVPIDRCQYAELTDLKRSTRIPVGEMVRDAVDWWLECKAPVLRQTAEKTLCGRRKTDRVSVDGKSVGKKG